MCFFSEIRVFMREGVCVREKVCVLSVNTQVCMLVCWVLNVFVCTQVPVWAGRCY